jgi:hypothetical protein
LSGYSDPLDEQALLIDTITFLDPLSALKYIGNGSFAAFSAPSTTGSTSAPPP